MILKDEKIKKEILTDNSKKLNQYQTMLSIRLFEEKIDYFFSKGLLGGTCHLCIGQEASAVGVISQLQKGDKVVSTHRGHGHAIAMGGNLSLLFAELMEKKIGYCMGRGGTQHICAKDLGFYGTNGITGGGIPIATGLALASKRDKKNKIVVSFFGDGAVNQGTFHESLNMASIWNLPIVYVCENNLYAMSMPIEKAVKNTNLASRAESYGIPGVVADGTNIEDVEEKSLKLIKLAREGKGPSLLEIKSYRYKGHSKSDNRVYRTREEEQNWMKKDGINILKNKLIKLGLKKEIQEIEEEVKKTIIDAEKIAIDAEYSTDYISNVR